MNQPNPSLEVLKSVLGGKVVSYHPVFARALRSVPAAVMLSQAFFWQENASFKDISDFGGKPFFSKTALEWYEATGVTDDAQLTARDVLRSSGFWLERRAGLPAKLYFHIDLDILVSVIYGFLENGKQVSVDTRHKNREITRASNGKFREPVSVNYGNTNKEESNKRVLESSEREDAPAQNQSYSEKQKKVKPPSSARPPAPAANPTATTFAESIWCNSTAGAWATALHEYDPETSDADADYYRARCRDWSAQNPAKPCANWLAKAAQFIRDDRAKQRLHTYQPFTSHDNYPNRPASGPSSTALLDRDSIVERAAAIASRLRSKHPERYQ